MDAAVRFPATDLENLLYSARVIRFGIGVTRSGISHFLEFSPKLVMRIEFASE